MKNDQKGFGIVEVLLAIIAMSLVCFVGFYVYNANKKTDQSNASQTKVADSQAVKKSDTDKTVETKKLAIKELGLTLDLSTGLNDLVYGKSAYDDRAGSIEFKSATFTKLVTDCRSANSQMDKNITLGKAVRYSGVYNPNSADNNEFEDLVNQFDDFYITFGTADGGICDNGDEAAATKVAKEYELLKNQVLTAIKAAKTI